MDRQEAEELGLEASYELKRNPAWGEEVRLELFCGLPRVVIRSAGPWTLDCLAPEPVID
jgi:hypothetical protein